MARRRRRQVTRDTKIIANDLELRDDLLEQDQVDRLPSRLQDLRRFDPEPLRTYRTLRDTKARINAPRVKPTAIDRRQLGLVSFLQAVVNERKRAKVPEVTSRLAFVTPKETVVCVRRKQRREVLLAKGHGGHNKRPRWSEFSFVKC